MGEVGVMGGRDSENHGRVGWGNRGREAKWILWGGWCGVLNTSVLARRLCGGVWEAAISLGPVLFQPFFRAGLCWGTRHSLG